MRPRMAIIAVAAALALPASATANTFCVHAPPGCAGPARASVQAAIDDAASSAFPLADTVFVGAGSFAETWRIPDGTKVHVRGAGRGADGTEIVRHAHVGAPSVGDHGSVSDLRFAIRPDVSLGLDVAGAANRVAVVGESGLRDAVGIALRGGGALADADVTLPTGANVGVRAADGASLTIAASTVTAARAVVLAADATVTTSRLRGEVGVEVAGVPARIDNTVIELRDVPGAVEHPAGVLATAAPAPWPQVSASRLTIVSDGLSDAVALAAVASAAAPSARAMLTAREVVALTPRSVASLGVGDDSALVIVLDSLLDQSATGVIAAGGGSVSLAESNRFADPRLVDVGAGDYRPRFDSPLVDAGGAAQGFDAVDKDAGGRRRHVDGDGDGVIRRDIGALEYQRAAPVAVGSTPVQVAEADVGLTFDASASSDPDPGEGLHFHWAFDDGTTTSGAVVSKAFATLGAHAATLTVTDPTGVSDTHRASVSVRASATRRVAPSPEERISAPDAKRSWLAWAPDLPGETLRLSGKDTVAVRLRCRAPDLCRGLLELRTVAPMRLARGRPAKPLVLGSAKFSKRRFDVGYVGIHLTRASARRLRHLGRLRVRLTALARGSAGDTRTATRVVTLVAPPPR